MIVLACSATGGHVYPAIAVKEYLNSHLQHLKLQVFVLMSLHKLEQYHQAQKTLHPPHS